MAEHCMISLSGVTRYDPEKAFAGYTLWAPIATMLAGADAPGQCPGQVILMDMEGSIVHSWKTPFPTFYGYLLPNGHLLAGLRTTESYPGRPGVGEHAMGGTQGWLMEFDWDGNVVFSHKDLTMHHDFKKLANGNYAYLSWEPMTPEEQNPVQGGIKGSESTNGIMWVDVIKEIDPQGNLVWEWHAKDHLDPDRHIIGPIHHRCEWSHCNTLWECENGDIMSSSRYLDMAFRIQRSTGKIIWEWGNGTYKDPETGRLELRVDQKTLGGQHDVHVIPSGLPGAGNMLCYDNGMYKYVSRAVEVDMHSGEVVWDSAPYGYVRGRVPFSSFISGARRLPNGNTLCCEGANGHFYEITPDLDIVWEYWRPEPDLACATPWTVFRCFRYAPDYCAQFASLPPCTGQ